MFLTKPYKTIQKATNVTLVVCLYIVQDGMCVLSGFKDFGMAPK